MEQHSNCHPLPSKMQMKETKGYCVMTFPANNSHMYGILKPITGTVTGAEI